MTLSAAPAGSPYRDTVFALGSGPSAEDRLDQVPPDAPCRCLRVDSHLDCRCAGEVGVTRTPIGCLTEGEQPDNGATVGVERGVTVPLMLSDGSSCELPHEIERLERKHRRAQGQC